MCVFKKPSSKYKSLTSVHIGLFISFKAVPAIVTTKPPFVEPVAVVMADILGFRVTNRESVKYFKMLKVNSHLRFLGVNYCINYLHNKNAFQSYDLDLEF